jgi:threonyl-tRNA synthetase
MADISITLPDGSRRALAEGATATTLAESIGSRLAKAAVAAVVNGEEWDLGRALPDGAEVAITTGDSDEGRHVLRAIDRPRNGLRSRCCSLAPFSIDPRSRTFYYDFELR